jgi:hypothetical protein
MMRTVRLTVPLAVALGAALAAPARAQQAPLALSADRTEVQVGEAVTFTVRELDGVDVPDWRQSRVQTVAYALTFGDGERQTLRSLQTRYTYEAPGTYQAIVRLVDDGELAGARSNAVTITVAPRPPPLAVRLAATPTEATVGDRVAFEAVPNAALERLIRSEGSVQFEFTFGAGRPVSTSNRRVTRVAQEPGRLSASVRVVVTGGDWVVESPTVVVPVRAAPEPPPEPPPEVRPTVRLLANPRTAEADEPVTFRAIVDPIPNPGTYTYTFLFGDGSDRSGSAARVVHRYRGRGSFPARVEIRRGRQVVRSAPVAITVRPRPAPPDEVPEDEPVPQDDPPDDGPPPPDDPPVLDDADEPVPDDEPEPAPSIGLAATADVVLIGAPVTFAAAASGAGPGDLYEFLLDGRPAGTPGPDPRWTQAFEEVGTVVASVWLLRDGEAVAASEPVRVTVTAPDAPVDLRLVVDPEAPRPDEPVTFSAAGVAGGAGVAYRFHFGDGETSDWLAAGVAEHVYRAAGSYDAQVEVRGLGGTAGLVTSAIVPVPVEAGPSIPWWALVLGAAVAGAGALAWRRWRSQPAPEPAPPPLVGLKARPDAGSARVAASGPVAAEWEVRLRPVPDAGRHRIETREPLEV